MRLGRSFTIIAALLALLPSVPCRAQSGPVVIWPVDPVIGDKQRATALWLENPGKTPLQFQVRVFDWNQTANRDAYAAQSEVIGTPPVVRIDPGQRQLVRLTRARPVPAGVERAYRVVVDELPAPDATRPAAEAARIQFRMRYVIPLFSYGAGMAAPKPGGPPQPVTWRIVTEAGQRFLEIGNPGTVHVRLVNAAFTGDRVPFAGGLLGYVLPGATMRWPMPEKSGNGALRIVVNGTPAVIEQGNRPPLMATRDSDPRAYATRVDR